MADKGWELEFFDCIANNELDRVHELVQRHRIDLRTRFPEIMKKVDFEMSHNHLVADEGYVAMLQYLCQMKCNFHLTTARLHRTALHYTTLRHKVPGCKWLLSIGVDPDPRDSFGNTPCHYAAENGDLEILDILFEHSIDINVQDITFKTPLMKATRNGETAAVQRLITGGCKVNVCDKNRDTALHFACRQSNVALVVLLLEAGSDVNIQNQWGNTPLMEAVCYNNRDLIPYLLKANSDVNLGECTGGDTVLHVAIRKNYVHIVEQLLCSGKPHGIYNNSGEHAIYDAVIKNKLAIIRLFMDLNFDFDKPVKLKMNSSGEKTAMILALEHSHLKMLSIFCAVGYNTWAASHDEKLHVPFIGVLNTKETHGSEDIVVDLPVSLKRNCRKTVRKLIGYGIQSKVTSLPLPSQLLDYLLLKDICF